MNINRSTTDNNSQVWKQGELAIREPTSLAAGKAAAEIFASKQPSKPLSLKLTVPLGTDSFQLPVNYVDAHLAFEPVNEAWVQELAVYLCSLSCKAFDIARGHLSIDVLKKALTKDCLKKLQLFARLLKDSDFARVHRSGLPISFPPVFPIRVEVFAVGQDRYEATTNLVCMSHFYLTNINLERKGSSWVCPFLDLGC